MPSNIICLHPSRKQSPAPSICAFLQQFAAMTKETETWALIQLIVATATTARMSKNTMACVSKCVRALCGSNGCLPTTVQLFAAVMRQDEGNRKEGGSKEGGSKEGGSKEGGSSTQELQMALYGLGEVSLSLGAGGSNTSPSLSAEDVGLLLAQFHAKDGDLREAAAHCAGALCTSNMQRYLPQIVAMAGGTCMWWCNVVDSPAMNRDAWDYSVLH
jgi:hypothetical protein